MMYASFFSKILLAIHPWYVLLRWSKAILNEIFSSNNYTPSHLICYRNNSYPAELCVHIICFVLIFITYLTNFKAAIGLSHQKDTWHWTECVSSMQKFDHVRKFVQINSGLRDWKSRHVDGRIHVQTAVRTTTYTRRRQTGSLCIYFLQRYYALGEK